MFDLIVIGGGAAGFFAALTAKKTFPHAKVAIFEKSGALLSKVRISGGGRCNVTHHCFDPEILAKNYPRGGKELIGPFHRFSPKDTIAWFTSRGVELKKEEDGRMFPVTDSSQTIIDCLMKEAAHLGVEIHLKMRIEAIEKTVETFELTLAEEKKISCKRLILATGSYPDGHLWAKHLGHTIDTLLPSLFTFNVPSSTLTDLSGISMPDVEVKLVGFHRVERGPILLTHFGFSGPAIIKLSSWAAPFLFERDYRSEVIINWLPDLSAVQIESTLLALKSEKHLLANLPLFGLPKALWHRFTQEFGDKKACDVPLKVLRKMGEKLRHDVYQIEGKTTFKKEFVTCGGVNLKEIDFKKMQSKICPGLFFTGEILNIDGVTGGFNFQNAWTTGYIAGSSLDLY